MAAKFQKFIMDTNFVKEWLIPISTCIGIVSTTVAVVMSVCLYRLKVKAEIRLKNSSRVEMDIQLLKLFTEIMNIAHARGEARISEKAIETLLTQETVNKFAGQGKELGEFLENAAILTLPVGAAAQDSAIAAIGILGLRHELLHSVSIQALESLSAIKPELANKYLTELKNNQSKNRKILSANNS